MKKTFWLFLGLLVLLFACKEKKELTEITWPEIKNQHKPWTRWWWHGSSVNQADISSELNSIQQVGIGGVEITPTFGAKGYENTYLPYLSSPWLDVFSHTLQEAKRLDLGVDMALGTGWNFGGPHITDSEAPQHIVYKKFELSGGEQLNEKIVCSQKPYVRFVLNQVYEVHGSYALPGEVATASVENAPEITTIKNPSIKNIKRPVNQNNNLQGLAIDQVRFDQRMPLVSLMAFSEDGDIIELTNLVDSDGNLSWVAPAGIWTLYGIFQGQTGKMVERAAPGGEGFMINHFSKEALLKHLNLFDTAFIDIDISSLRGFFNDSYEVDDAKYRGEWTKGFFEEFENRRGYDLKQQLPTLFGEKDSETHQRVLSDYRETISDLMLDNFTVPWYEWSENKGKIIRNQAHGSPANLLDLYGASHIPETEGVDWLRIKFASSAANVMGRKLVSSESGTFLNENFTTTLDEIKRNLDRFFLGGVNHVFYHGTAFTPSRESWPGWFFYVSIHMNPRNSWWEHSKAVHQYASRVQSFLQESSPDNDILLYFPIYDRYAISDVGDIRSSEGDGPGKYLIDRFTVDNDRWASSSVKSDAEWLKENGFAFDFISDKQIQDSEAEGKQTITPGDHNYKTIWIPKTGFMPLKTYKTLMDLAQKGVPLIFHEGFPEKVSGFLNSEQQQEEFNKITQAFEELMALNENQIRVLDSNEISRESVPTRFESLRNLGIDFIRKKTENGPLYFIRNNREDPINEWIKFNSSADHAVIFDPMTGVSGIAASRQVDSKLTEVKLHLKPSETLLIQFYDRVKPVGDTFPFYKSADAEIAVEGKWKLNFISGGPVVPDEMEFSNLSSWTDLEVEELKNFSGTGVYTTNINYDPGDKAGIWLDLGKVHESATVFWNGDSLATLIGPEYSLFIPSDKIKSSNQLEVRVANLSANRISYLDREGVFWKKFYNNNIRPMKAENRDEEGMFTAVHWQPLPSGLVGPVRIIPVDLNID